MGLTVSTVPVQSNNNNSNQLVKPSYRLNHTLHIMPLTAIRGLLFKLLRIETRILPLMVPITIALHRLKTPLAKTMAEKETLVTRPTTPTVSPITQTKDPKLVRTKTRMLRQKTIPKIRKLLIRLRIRTGNMATKRMEIMGTRRMERLTTRTRLTSGRTTRTLDKTTTMLWATTGNSNSSTGNNRANRLRLSRT